jgi:hypothetical protein
LRMVLKISPAELTFNLNVHNYKHWINIKSPFPNVLSTNAGMPRCCRPWLWSDGRMGNAKPNKQVVCLSHIFYWSRSFCFLAHVPGWDELSFTKYRS